MPESASTNLHDWQNTMGDFLLQPSLQAHYLQAWLSPCALNGAAMQVYRNNMLYSLTTAMAAQFPVVQRLVGEEFFTALARDFVLRHPPQQAELTFYGEQFPDFIREHPHCTSLPYLSDVASLEFACQWVLHAADASPLVPGRLLSLDPETLLQQPLPLLPAVKLLRSPWPVHLIREVNRANSDQQIQIANDSACTLLIRRIDDLTQVCPLTAQVFGFLEALQQGCLLLEAWEQVQRQFTLPDQQFTAVLSQALQLHIFAAPQAQPAEPCHSMLTDGS